MDFLNELLGKLPKFVNKSISDQKNTGKLQKFGEAHSLKLDIYYELWRSKVNIRLTPYSLISISYVAFFDTTYMSYISK